MHLVKENLEAAKFAKEKVHEIRSKIYDHSAVKPEAFSTSQHSRATSSLRSTPGQHIHRRQSTEELGGRKERQSRDIHNENKEYYHRIKNINCINQKIRMVLGEKSISEHSNFRCSQGVKVKNSEGEPARNRENAPADKENQKIFEKLPIQEGELKNNKFAVSIEIPPRVTTQNEHAGEVKDVHRQDASLQSQKESVIIRSELKSDRRLPEKSAFLLIPKEEPAKGFKKYEDETVEKVETTKLAELLGKQIQMDQELRERRWVFEEAQEPGKWEKLLSEMVKVVPSLTLDRLKSEICISSEEHNPFFQASSAPKASMIGDLVESYRKAKEFWEREVQECAGIARLEMEGFNIRNIDLSKKGYITIEDLVCFVNLYSGSFFRNRDVVALYRRFLGGDKETGIKYESFLEKITHN